LTVILDNGSVKTLREPVGDNDMLASRVLNE
jgi:hypothetical protein